MDTKLMGILNVTPDSFYDGGKYVDPEAALKRAFQMIEEGADLLDIGGESTRPGAEAVSEQEEICRVVPVIKEIRRVSSIPLSIDTCKVRVAEAALEAGATLINDVSGFRDLAMRRLAAEAGTDICVMHMQGSPQNMQINPDYPDGLIPSLLHYFDRQIELLIAAGVDPRRIILDPGIGFGKTVADNLQIIHNLPKLKERGFPVLLGVSRKTFLQRILSRPASEMLAGTIAINTFAVQAGVDFLRVHDVLPHRDMVILLNRLRTC
ncbi:MAG: dihydropteroate synthase [Parachlamydia sp.]|nr:dihydropteroate synthase [Parachlamydia sp.]